MHDVVAETDEVFSGERRFERAHLVEDAAHGPDIDFEVVGFLLDEFGSEVERRADARVLGGELVLDYLGDAHVPELMRSGYLDAAVEREEDVEGFDVSVDDVVVVQVEQGVGELLGDAPDLGLLDLGAVLFVGLDVLRERTVPCAGRHLRPAPSRC